MSTSRLDLQEIIKLEKSTQPTVYDATLLEAYPHFISAFTSYLSNQDLVNLSSLNRFWRTKTSKLIEARQKHSLVYAILEGDEQRIITILTLQPDILLQTVNEIGIKKLICPYTKREFSTSLTLFELGVLNRQFRTINLLTYFLDLIPNSHAKKEKALATLKTLADKPAEFEIQANPIAIRIKNLIDLIETKDIDPLNEEIEAELNELKKLFNKPLHFNNVFDIASNIAYAHELYGEKLDILSLEKANYFYINVIGFLQKCMPPEMANLYCSRFLLSATATGDNQAAKVFQLEIASNLGENFYNNNNPNIVFMPGNANEVIIDTTKSKIQFLNYRRINVVNFRKLQELEQMGLEEIANLHNESDLPDVSRKDQANEIIKEANSAWSNSKKGETDKNNFISAYVKAIFLNPTDHMAMHKLGLFYQNHVSDNHAHLDAEKYLERSTYIYQQNTETYLDLAKLQIKRKAYIEALYNLNLALKYEHKNKVAIYLLRAEIYSEMGMVIENVGLAINEFHYAQKITGMHNYKFNELLQTLGKEGAFAAIKTLPLTDQQGLLRACLDQTTQIGQLFWKPRGATGCALNKGILRDICVYLASIDPNYVLPQSISSVSIFKKVAAVNLSKSKASNGFKP